MARNKASRTRRARLRTQEKRRRQITATGVLAIAVVIVWGLIRGVQPQPIGEITLPSPITSPPGANGMAWGPLGAPVVIEEFSDFQ